MNLIIFQSPPTWVQMQSVSQAKSKLGHAVTMILQVGVLEKFKSIPLVTPLDLACFAGAVLMSSACIFLLSKLSVTSFGRQILKDIENQSINLYLVVISTSPFNLLVTHLISFYFELYMLLYMYHIDTNQLVIFISCRVLLYAVIEL